jgi:uncharacterized protein with ParB-like and HNH nuclease domain
MKTGRYSLKDLLTHNEIDQIIIPEIQRDYVWQEINVTRLLDTILEHFQKKQDLIIEIRYGERLIENDFIKGYLKKELERFQHHLKLGFIYAYHDPFFPGKFFLIDGQQRLTTLYLLLLALYKAAGRSADFRAVYFNHSKLKIDYRVREAAHDFMQEFFEQETRLNETNITNSKNYYRHYDSDTTIQNLIYNYKAICIGLNDKQIDFNALIEYVEQFVEVNYFDTHLSRQGEALYLFMNSRGEGLSFQESIKSALIQKIELSTLLETGEAKRAAGLDWENWQNFFWINRFYGNKGESRENADQGFKLFLKWASIIQICTTIDPSIEIGYKDKELKVSQSALEATEDYIKLAPIRNQEELLANYQTLSPGFDFNYLKSVYAALETLYQDPDLCKDILEADWLAALMSVLSYIVLLPLLYAQMRETNSSDSIKRRFRLGMFLINLTYFRGTLARNPDRATIDILKLTELLYLKNNPDITDLLNINAPPSLSSILTSNEVRKLRILKKQEAPNTGAAGREQVEQFFWKLTNDETVSGFLEGNSDILLDCVEAYTGRRFPETPLNRQDLVLLDEYYQVFKKVFLPVKATKRIRRILLTFGDYTLYDGGGSWLTGNYLKRFCFIKDDSEWRKLFMNQDKKGIFIALMESLRVEMIERLPMDIDSLGKRYLASFVNEGNKFYPLIKYPFLLDYCKNRRFLWDDGDRMIVLTGKIANTDFISLQTLLISQLWEGCAFEYNTCYKTFSINGHQINLEVDYTPSGWLCSISNPERDKPFHSLDYLIGNDWERAEHKLRKITPFMYNGLGSFMAETRDAIIEINKLAMLFLPAALQDSIN